MFLNSLNKKQKNAFLKLAIKAAEANGVVELVEKNMLKAYGIEMEITPFYSTNCDTEAVLQELKDTSTKSELKIVLFELLGILISDETFDKSEIEFINKVRTSFGVSQDKCDEMLKLLYDYSSVYKKIVTAIF